MMCFKFLWWISKEVANFIRILFTVFYKYYIKQFKTGLSSPFKHLGELCVKYSSTFKVSVINRIWTLFKFFHLLILAVLKYLSVLFIK